MTCPLGHGHGIVECRESFNGDTSRLAALIRDNLDRTGAETP
jgi:hypothetical protein